MVEFSPEVLSEEWIDSLLSELSEAELEKGKERSLIPMLDQVLFEGVPNTATVRDYAGKELIDCTSQAWTLNVGFVNPDVMCAVAHQMKRLTHVRFGYPTIPRIKLINSLVDLFEGRFGRVSLNNEGGGFGIECAMKLAMISKPGCYTFLTTWRGYHGSSLALMAASAWMPMITRFPGYGREHYVKVPYPFCYRCPLELSADTCETRCLDMLEGTLRHGVTAPVAGIILEPIQAPGGMVPAPRAYLEKLRELCDRFGIPLIFDECQTGFGRVGAWSASEYHDIWPDMLVLNKGAGGGLPIGILMAREDFPYFTIAEEHTTFCANPLMCAAALANIEVVKKMDLLRRSRELGDRITGRLKEYQEKHDIMGDVRGPGLFIGIDMVEDRETRKPATMAAEAFINKALEEGVIFGLSLPDLFLDGTTGRNVVMIKPPLTITDAEVERMLEVFEACLEHVGELML